MADQTSQAAKVSEQAIQASVKALTSSLASLLKVEEAQVIPFATQYGPVVARWGVELEAAKAANDTAQVSKLEASFQFVTDEAVLQAADLGELAQEQTENFILASLRVAAAFAGSALAAAA